MARGAIEFAARDRTLRLGLKSRSLRLPSILLLLLTSLPLGALSCSAGSHAASVDLPSHRRILVLYSGESLLSANIIFDEMLRRALGTLPGEPIECNSEFLDETRFPTRHQERMLQFLLSKYEARPPDVIVAVSPPSLEFCTRFHRELFVRTPIVFATDGESILEAGEATPLTGVRSNNDGPATLRLALQLHPKTQQVFVVTDSSLLDHAHTVSGWSDFRESDFLMRFEHLTSQPLQQLLDRLAHLPDQSLVIYQAASGSVAASSVSSQTLAEHISVASRAPVYAALGALVGHGILGAVSTPTGDIARETAELVMQVLLREDDKDIPPVRAVPARPLFDWQQMQRWNVRAKQLPPGSIVLFAPPSLWQQHAKWVATVAVVFLVQSGLILALILQSARRRRAEREALRRRQELAHTTRVATIGELTASLAHEINQPLAAILSNAQAAQRLLANGNSDGDEIRDILADIAADDLRAGEVIRRMRALLRKGESEPTTLDVNELVSEVADLVHGEMILQDVTLVLNLWQESLWVHVDRIQLQQVLLNLIMNALDAMKDTSSGERKLDIRTRSEGHVVRVSVSDTGVGIPADRIDRIFDHFVTTKPHGMGLGLAICRSIIEGHGGQIGGANNQARGATFWFDVPMSEKVKS